MKKIYNKFNNISWFDQAIIWDYKMNKHDKNNQQKIGMQQDLFDETKKTNSLLEWLLALVASGIVVFLFKDMI